MLNSEMVQPTQGAEWKNDQPAGEFFGMMRLHVSGDRWIHSVGSGPAVEAAILRKKEEDHGIRA
ncbi:hypothetical protein [Sphingomonas abaci]|uniref:Uncharacterized protein n=1 Tax=Sphingomonas abaci TaxID=237611 RepID=A0A7W7EWV8_9SPHN|nr:hypothetical protein [Sphingomonas abaci]MBB4616952.1 hypothetical protein [Sphingomonas abaci]